MCLPEKEGIPGGSAEPDGGGHDEGGRGEEARPDGPLAHPLRVEAPLGAAADNQRQEVAAAQVSREIHSRNLGHNYVALCTTYRVTQQDFTPEIEVSCTIFERCLTKIAFLFSCRAYNIPEKYLREIEKKCHQMAKSRFSLSYFGKK